MDEVNLGGNILRGLDDILERKKGAGLGSFETRQLKRVERGGIVRSNIQEIDINRIRDVREEYGRQAKKKKQSKQNTEAGNRQW